MPKKLLCATDGSHASLQAVDFAIDFARSLGTQLAFLTVDGAPPSAGALHDSTLLTAAEAQLRQELQVAATRARAAGLDEVRCVLARGHDIAATIVAYAEEHGYDHIVTGSAGRTGISRLLLGSVAAAVVARAHCPVTVVR